MIRHIIIYQVEVKPIPYLVDCMQLEEVVNKLELKEGIVMVVVANNLDSKENKSINYDCSHSFMDQ
jgi:hypothetical protein